MYMREKRKRFLSIKELLCNLDLYWITIDFQNIKIAVTNCEFWMQMKVVGCNVQ